MDVSQIPVVGPLAGLGILVVVIVYQLSSNRADRIQYAAALAGQAVERAAEKAACDERIERLEHRVDALEAQVDKEQDLRRMAQDRAAASDRRSVLAEAKADAAVAAAEVRVDALQKIIESRGL